jgi:predicted ATPase
VSEHTYRLTEGYFQFKELGAAKVQGVSEPVHIYEVVGVGPLRTRFQLAARRGLVRFVGRHGEMEQMKRAFEMAKGGHGQVVGVVGEPGVGKSRLFYEFKLIEQRDCLVLETFSVSHGKAYPYLPLIELLKNYFQITPTNDERKRREKVTGRVLTLDRSLEDTLPYLFSLLGISDPASSIQQMDPQIKQKRTFEAIKRLLLRESLNQPLLSIFEDLHWLDNETQALLDVLSESMATARILLLVNYRPEYRHDWGSKTYYTQLRLDPLQSEDAQELLTALLGNGTALRPLKQVILTKTEGNPFFMEEVVQTLAEEKVLVGDRGNYWFEKAPKELHIPTTVQGVLASRIDRLGVEGKELFQTLAVIGKKFSLGIIKKVMNKPEEELYPLLSHLQGAEFIYEQPAFPEVEYTFKHALTQEVAYNSVLIERRKVLHERTAQAIEELYHDELDKHYSDLAHQYSRSDNTKKAVEYLHLSGRQAVQGSANVEAVNHLTTALELLKTLPDTPERAQQELTLQITLGAPLMVTKGYAAPEVQKTYARARELCQNIGETPHLYPVLFGLWSVFVVRAEHKMAKKLGEQILALARSLQDPALLLVAHYVLGITLISLGELVAARQHTEQGIALYDPRQHRSLAFLYGEDLGVGCLSFSAWILWIFGYPDQALKRIHDALGLAQETSHSFSLVLALACATWVHLFRREVQAAEECAEAAITLSTEQGFAFYWAWGTIQRSWALSQQGQVEEGIAQMERGLTAYRATGAEWLRSCFLVLLAEVHAKGGQSEAGLRALAEAAAVLNKTEERISEAELYRLKGDLLLDLLMENQTEVEASFRRAINISRRQSAKSLELRAVMSLSRFWQKQGKQEEARQMLAETYGWFTEGFDTADLKEAKALLQELS